MCTLARLSVYAAPDHCGYKAGDIVLGTVEGIKVNFIEEIQSHLVEEEYCKNQRIQPSSVDLLLTARFSIATISSRPLSDHCKREFRQQVIERHDRRLSKILEVAELENSNQVWKRIPSRSNFFR